MSVTWAGRIIVIGQLLLESVSLLEPSLPVQLLWSGCFSTPNVRIQNYIPRIIPSPFSTSVFDWFARAVMSGRQRVDTVMVDSLHVDSPLALLPTDGTDTALQRASRSFVPVNLPFIYLMPPYVIWYPRPSPSTFAYCDQSKTGGGNDLGLRLLNHTYHQHTLIN